MQPNHRRHVLLKHKHDQAGDIADAALSANVALYNGVLSFTAAQTINVNGAALVLKGGAVGATNQAFMQFKDSAGTVTGYVGDVDTGNSDIHLASVSGAVRFYGTGLKFSLDGGTTTFDFTPASSSFTAALTGMTASTTRQMFYRISNNICTLYMDNSLLGTSNTTAMTLTGLPAACQPTTSRVGQTLLVDNSVVIQATYSISAGTITFSAGATGTGSFTAANAKGLGNGWSISYPLTN
jgi:hypothetical protein